MTNAFKNLTAGKLSNGKKVTLLAVLVFLALC